MSIELYADQPVEHLRRYSTLKRVTFLESKLGLRAPQLTSLSAGEIGIEKLDLGLMARHDTNTCANARCVRGWFSRGGRGGDKINRNSVQL